MKGRWLDGIGIVGIVLFAVFGFAESYKTKANGWTKQLDWVTDTGKIEQDIRTLQLKYSSGGGGTFQNLSSYARQKQDATFKQITVEDGYSLIVGGSGGLYGTLITNQWLDTDAVYTNWFGSNQSNAVETSLILAAAQHPANLGNPHATTADQIFSNHTGNKYPLFAPDNSYTWKSPLEACVNIFDGAPGAPALFCSIDGGTRSITYDATGANPTAMSAFTMHLFEGAAEVTPLYWSWATGGASNRIYGTGIASSFTPSVKSAFSQYSSNNYVTVMGTYSSLKYGRRVATCGTPIAVSRIGIQGPTGSQGIQGFRGYSGAQGVQGEQGFRGYSGATGATGAQGIQGEPGTSGSPDTQAQILTKIATQTDGAVLKVRQGSTEAGTVAKFAVEDVSGNTRNYIDGDGSQFQKDASGTVKYSVVNGVTTIRGTTATDGPTMGSELLPGSGWTAGAGWTESPAGTFTHASGTATLSNATAVVVGNKYLLSWTVTGRTAGSFVVSIGGVVSSVAHPFPYSTSTSFGCAATTTTGLIITPTTDFNGSISGITLKQLTAVSSPLTITYSSGGLEVEHTRKPMPAANSNNQFYGYGAGGYLSSASHSNIGLGRDALRWLVQGAGNVGIGQFAFYKFSGGSYNSGLGRDALGLLEYGYYNTAIGRTSGYSITSGSNNTFLGNAAGYNASQKVDPINSMALGANTYTTADNQIVIGDTSITQTKIRGNIQAVGYQEFLDINGIQRGKIEPSGQYTRYESNGNIGFRAYSSGGYGVYRNGVLVTHVDRYGQTRKYRGNGTTVIFADYTSGVAVFGGTR